MKKLSFILIFLASITFQSCDLFNMDNDPTLPEITQEGKGTFGCMIDGELFLPKGPDPSGGQRGNPHARYTGGDGTLILKSQNIDSWNISLLITEVFNEEERPFHKNGNLRDLLAIDCKDYLVDTLNSTIDIQYLNTDEDIISGIFSAHFINECDSTKIIQITDGRFDLIYTL